MKVESGAQARPWRGHFRWALTVVLFFVSLKGALGCAQSDSPPPPRAEVLDPGSSHGCHGDARELQGLAGLWML